LLSQSKLSNGLNGLDYFHQSLIKMKRVPGAKGGKVGGGLDKVAPAVSTMIGSEFSDPTASQPADASDKGRVG
jgi:hypothetical protein